MLGIVTRSVNEFLYKAFRYRLYEYDLAPVLNLIFDNLFLGKGASRRSTMAMVYSYRLLVQTAIVSGTVRSQFATQVLTWGCNPQFGTNGRSYGVEMGPRVARRSLYRFHIVTWANISPFSPFAPTCHGLTDTKTLTDRRN